MYGDNVVNSNTRKNKLRKFLDELFSYKVVEAHAAKKKKKGL
jgi:hypothetical protein